MIHIEGMGWFGSLIAYRLHAEKIPFTWNDTEDSQNSWEASTGLVYPAGDERSEANLAAWAARDQFLPHGTVERVDYLFSHKNPPHGGKWPYEDLGFAKMAHASAYSVNVPVIVKSARRGFAHLRLEAAPSSSQLIVAHGSARATSYVWGWSVPVSLSLPRHLSSPHRPVFYGRQVRRLAYAYALPGTPLHLAGSTLVRQTVRKELDAEKHYERWLKDFAACFPEVGVTRIGEPKQGWRPRPDDGDDRVMVRGGDGAIMVPALWHSGVRWAPEILKAVMMEVDRA